MLITAQAINLIRQGKPLGIPLSFHVLRGELLWVRGANGVGKSTLLQVLAGILHPTPEHALIWADSKPSIFYLGHQLGLVARFTVHEQCLYHPALSEPSSSEIRDALALFGIEALADTVCSRLSRGQQQRLALTVAYLSGATVWLLDEPFTGLDLRAVEQLKVVLKKQSERGAVVLISHHDLSDIATQTLTLGEDVYALA